jgi:pimeloyl-ACP methyl ester carboxylesterase
MALSVYPWKRFWYPREGQASLADDGFLLDPDSEAAKYHPTDVVAFEAISDTPCLILLGEPGIGKSIALKNEFENVEKSISGSSGQALWFDLRDFSSEDRLERMVFESEEIRKWQGAQNTLHLFLDSVDEGLLRIDNISRVLLSGLQRFPPDRLRLRIASRPLDWPVTLENGLVGIWGQDNVRVFQLAPLGKRDVAVAAELSGISAISANQFVDQVIGRNVVPFAIKPVTLKFLVGVFDKGGTLPTSRAELYFEGCKRLCEEQNLDRRDSPKARGNLVPSQCMAIAARIAAVTQISNRSAIWIGLDEGLQPEDVALESLVGGFEGDPQYEIVVNLTTIREALGTGLFSSRGQSRQGWQHQTYAEYLAAFYMKAHRVPVDLVRGLLLHPDGSGKVIPQLRELAVWLSDMNPQIFELLARTDPEILLRSDMAVGSSVDRTSLAGHLLECFESGGVTESLWRMRGDFARLNNPELPGIVRPYLSDISRPWEARVAAIEIVNACRLTALRDDLVRIAMNPSEPIRVRSRAAAGIAEIGDAKARAALRPLALGLAGDDPDDELKGYGLLATWPAHLSAQELFAALTPIKNTKSFGGAYYSFLDRGITEELRPDDFVTAINWAHQHARGRDKLDRFHKLASDILERAADHIDQPQVLELLASALFKRMQDYTDCDRITAKLYACGDATRRAVARSMFSAVAADRHGAFFVMDACALGAHDIPWLLNELMNTSADTARRVIAEVISRRLDPQDVDTFAAVLGAAPVDQILGAAIEPVVSPVYLGSPRAARLKADHDLFVAHQQPKIVSSSVPITQRVSEILGDGNPESFFRIYWLLQNTEQDTSNDAEPLRGWAELDGKTQILSAAFDYLKMTPPLPQGIWWKEGKFTNGMLAGSCALGLLALHSPALLDQLADSDWALWTKVVLVDSSAGTDASIRSILVSKAYQRARSTFLSTFNDIVDEENERYKEVFVIWHIAEFWNDELATILRSKIANGTLNPKSFKNVLAKLLSMADSAAKELAQTVAAGVIPSDGEGRRRAVYATAELISHDPREWNTVWRSLQANESFGVEVLQVIASEHEYNSFATALAESEIADICIWLSNGGFDKAEDDPNNPGRVTPAKALANWWNTLINFLTYKGTPSACDAIRKLIDALPQYEGLKWSLRQAEDRMRRATWMPLAPTEVLRLGVGDTRANLVISLHGIRTRGAWQKTVNSDLQRNGFRHELLDYDYFGVGQFVLPSRRARKIEWFRDEYEKRVKETGRVPSVIAHSFGTYIVAKAMEKYEEVRFDRVIFCGSIVRRDFDWDSLVRRGQVRAVLNEYGGKDVWVKLAKWFVADVGPSGALGFDCSVPAVYQRRRKLFRHSDYFYPLNYRENWIPFLRGDPPSEQPIELKRAANGRS